MIELAYASFGKPAPGSMDRRTHAFVWLMSALFVLASVVILAVMNFFALPTGTFVNFLGRNGVRFHFLKLFGAVPAIAVTLPVLMAYALWHQSQNHGLFALVWPMAAVWLLGGTLIALLAVLGRTGAGKAGETTVNGKQDRQ
ncbi:MAG: hypothetical protein CMJ42_03025 [Phyllobacteriaceae bacterium]|nr:hypothetical protein [Phyllobacteriaceae bacterium]MBA93055.1 hypothetical protein [Phyllobacteriaceae bacterium]